VEFPLVTLAVRLPAPCTVPQIRPL
jgi:hypothetical protein